MKALARQSLFDIAIQECGSIEAAFEIALVNGNNITDELINGEELTLPSVVNQKVVDLFSINEIKPATAITTTDVAQTIADEGIEFWAIEVDFVIS
jgi:hypothetical protein